jgi:hypothetical protein
MEKQAFCRTIQEQKTLMARAFSVRQGDRKCVTVNLGVFRAPHGRKIEPALSSNSSLRGAFPVR